MAEKMAGKKKGSRIYFWESIRTCDTFYKLRVKRKNGLVYVLQEEIWSLL